MTFDTKTSKSIERRAGRQQMFNKQIRNSRGFTLVEVSIIVMALAILSAILLPQIGVFLRDARFARAREDVAAIGVAMMQLLKDTGESSFHAAPQGNWRSPQRFSESEGQPIGLLIGDGDTPDGRDRFYDWRTPLGSSIANAGTDFADVWMNDAIVDTFANHLIQNNPADVNHEGGAGESWERYRTPADMVGGDYSSGVPGGLQFDSASGQGFNSEFAWRGPYLDAVRPDPWGNRYMANVAWFTMPQGADSSGFIRPIIVLSAGPDEEVDTPFDSIGGFVLGDDDIAYPVSYGSLR
jgi:type II secretory pathway pseudopilin PulG